jgi:hypothetical protein
MGSSDSSKSTALLNTIGSYDGLIDSWSAISINASKEMERQNTAFAAVLFFNMIKAAKTKRKNVAVADTVISNIEITPWHPLEQ